MKKTLFLFLFVPVLFAGKLYAQKLTEAQVPAAVKVAMKTRFPAAINVEWNLQADHNYEGSFKVLKNKTIARFKPAGNWIEIETEIKEAQLPAAVKGAVTRNYTGFKITETKTVEFPPPGEKLYEVHVKKLTIGWKLRIAGDGRIVEKKQKT